MLAGMAVAWAAPEWDNAKRNVEDFKRKAEELTRKTPSETKKIVAAICAADEDGRKSAASSASSSARSTISDQFRVVERAKSDALSSLDKVTGDDKREAERLEDDVKRRWDKLSDLTDDLRDGSHPVVKYMLERGGSAKRDRQGRCDAKDFSVGGGRAACLIARGDTCSVVEMSADSSRAISSAKSQANRVRGQLETELEKSDSEVIKRLISADRDFAKCKRFEASVECFKLCPDIGDDNRFRDSGPSWRSGC
jgi:hypothetical protein